MMELRFFEIYRSSEYLDLLLNGVLISASLTIAAGVMGFLLALSLSSIRYWKIPVLDQLATAYVDFIRNTPLIVQLFFISFGLPAALNYAWPFWMHALLALTINFSGYFAEILRSGFVSIPKGHIEAAAALNLSKVTTFRYIVLPQALVSMFPSLSSQFIFLFLTTGVISEIGVTDLTHAGVFIDSRSFRSFEVFITLTVLYIAISLFLKGVLQVVFEKTVGRNP